MSDNDSTRETDVIDVLEQAGRPLTLPEIVAQLDDHDWVRAADNLLWLAYESELDVQLREGCLDGSIHPFTYRFLTPAEKAEAEQRHINLKGPARPRGESER